jgi:hypothetical protein
MLWRNSKILKNLIKKKYMYYLKMSKTNCKLNKQPCIASDDCTWYKGSGCKGSDDSAPKMMSFKILGSGIGFKGGRYVASSKSVAANRAGSVLFRKIRNDAMYSNFAKKKSIKFILGESTSGSKHKSTAYEVTQNELSTPKKVTRGGVELVYKYKYTVVKLATGERKEDMTEYL